MAWCFDSTSNSSLEWWCLLLCVYCGFVWVYDLMVLLTDCTG